MVKRKVIYGSLDFQSSREFFDKTVNVFIEETINKDEYKIITYITNMFGQNSQNIRTEIVYIETPTRKVLTEKENNYESSGSK